MIRRAWLPAGAALAAGIVHAIAGRYLAAVDPIAALLGQPDAGVVVAAAGVAAARLFLLFVAPGWAAHMVIKFASSAARLCRAELIAGGSGPFEGPERNRSGARSTCRRSNRRSSTARRTG
jgi:hypothetical protein